MLENQKVGNIELDTLKNNAANLKSGMGAVSWAVLEMFKRAGMSSKDVEELHQKMNQYFPTPSNDECNAILKVVEARLQEDKAAGKDIWYT